MREFGKILDQMEQASQEGESVSVADVQAHLGSHAFASTLLLLGVLSLSPIGDIPGAPTVFSLFFVLVAGQLLLGRDAFWLPGFLRRRSMKAARLRKAIGVARPVARFLAQIIRPRLTWLTRGPYERAIGGLCVLLALTLPFLEFVPFGATVPSSALTLFALALVARDGLLAALALSASGFGLYLIASVLL